MLMKSLSALALGSVLLVAGQVPASAGGSSACQATVALAPVGSDTLGTYNRDYTAAAMPAGTVRTVYRVGQGAAAAAEAKPVTLAAAAPAAFEPAGDDGLGNYNGDYTAAAVPTGTVRTAYQVGRGGAAHLRDTLARAGGPMPGGQKTL